MMVTKKAEYAISTLAELARRRRDGYVASREIADAQQIPPKLIAQLVAVLGRAGLVTAVRGPSGGIRLVMDPEDVTLRQVIELFDGPVGIARCMIREGYCENQPLCPLRGIWATAQRRMLEVLEETTIADLAKAANTLKNRK
ncbi:MAG: Rrf2 family transcriptional regulator [Bacillota bacterium]